MIVMGYHPGLEDDAFYLAAIKRNLNPALFPHDADFFRLQFQATIFDKFIAASIHLSHVSLGWCRVALADGRRFFSFFGDAGKLPGDALPMRTRNGQRSRWLRSCLRFRFPARRLTLPISICIRATWRRLRLWCDCRDAGQALCAGGSAAGICVCHARHHGQLRNLILHFPWVARPP